MPSTDIDDTDETKSNKLVSLPKHSGAIFLKNDKQKNKIEETRQLKFEQIDVSVLKQNFCKSPHKNNTPIKISVKKEKGYRESIKKVLKKKDKFNYKQKKQARRALLCLQKTKQWANLCVV